MLRFKDFSACVFVDGVEVEYFEAKTKWDDSEEGQEVMHAYIVGEPGKTFTVSWKDHRGTKATSGHIFIDGEDKASAIMRAGRGKPVSRSGAKISADKLRPFRFANLNITSDDRLADKKKDKERLKEMSTIRLEITYVRVGPVVPFKKQEIHEWGYVHEETKALGLMTEYAPKITIPASRAVATSPLNPEQKGPDVQFIFTYATREHLMAADIIPNPRAPKITKGANVQNEWVIEDSEDESLDERVSVPRSHSKRNRGKSNVQTDTEDEDEDEQEVTKRPKLNNAARGSPRSGASSPERTTPPRAGTEDDLAELQDQLDKYNLQRSQEDDGDESHVETAMQVNEDDESQDL
ncbi:hypothetical protein RSOLAG1IB_01114 [Rhizoctonia solani AG-1 IB]|uniref:DUF7918 domain-containing protein n=2 Tax=Thanatephorus cucumeris (strain AG1-IB / isolate 7/3/14) TaxID=1108050 RepID=A0A0B7FAN8_THACB|nr:hypothetical protein RSOLAG1IB_01114 [Rhizoctonia solani AG-1 IB]